MDIGTSSLANWDGRRSTDLKADNRHRPVLPSSYPIDETVVGYKTWRMENRILPSKFASVSLQATSDGMNRHKVQAIPTWNTPRIIPNQAMGTLYSGQRLPISPPTRDPPRPSTPPTSPRPSTPPTSPHCLESLFTPPPTAIPVDPSPTPPPFPDHVQISKRTVHRISHVLVPSFPQDLTHAHYLRLSETDVDQLFPSSTRSSKRPSPNSATLADSFNQAYANNHSSSYPSSSEFGFDPRRRKKVGEIPINSSKRKRKRSSTYDDAPRAETITSSRSVEKKTATFNEPRPTLFEPASLSSIPADSPSFLPEDYDDVNLSYEFYTSQPSNIKPDVSLRGNLRSTVAMELGLPLSWLLHENDENSYHAMMLNTRFVRNSTISGRWGASNAPSKQTTHPKQQVEVGWNSSSTICPLGRRCANLDEEILTHGLRPASKALPVSPTETRPSSINRRLSTTPYAIPSTNRLEKWSDKTPSAPSIPPSPSTSESIAIHPGQEETNMTLPQSLPDKGKAKQVADSTPPTTNLQERHLSLSQHLPHEEQSHPFVYPQHQGDPGIFQPGHFPRRSLPNDGHPHLYPLVPRDETLFLFSQPPSPLNHASTSKIRTNPPPIREYLGLDNQLEGYALDVPILESQLDLSFGDLEFNQAGELTIDLLQDSVVRSDGREGTGTVDPSVFDTRPDSLNTPEIRVGRDGNERPAPPQPVFYEGSKLPPRSVTRVVSVQVRPPSVSDAPIYTPALFQNDGSTSEKKLPTEIRSSATNFSSHNGSSRFFSFSSHDDGICNSSESSSENETYDDASSINDEDEENTDNSPSRSEVQVEERGPYAYIYDMMPSKETVNSSRNRGKLWATCDEDLLCHQCRTRSNKVHASCNNDGCTKHYCIRCLVTRYEDGTFSFLKTVKSFECPNCCNYCSCDVCSTRRGETYVPLRGPRSTHGQKLPDHKRGTDDRRRLGGKTNLPSIQATDTTNEPLQYWGPIYDLECTDPIAKCFVSNGNHDNQVLAQPLTRPRRRKKRKRRVMYIGSFQPGWPSKPTVDVSPVNTDFKKRYYVGRRPPPIVPDTFRDDSPLTDLEGEGGERLFGDFWFSDSNDEATDDQGISRNQLEEEKLFLSRRSKERNPEPTYDANGLPISLDEHLVANTIQSAFAAIGIESHCTL